MKKVRKHRRRKSSKCCRVALYAAFVVCLYGFLIFGLHKYTGVFGNIFGNREVEDTTSEEPRLTTDPKEIQERLKILRKACRQPASYSLYDRTDETKQQPIVWFLSGRAKLAVCKVPKTGSTLLGLIFIALETHAHVQRVFETNRVMVHDGRYEKGIRFIKYLQKMPDSQTVLVSRNPYSRLYSAYVDKIYLLGRLNRLCAEILNKGLYSDKNMDVCGYDITFEEFLSVVLKQFHKNSVDSHWSPISKMCYPCGTKYDVIAKQESLAADLRYVIDRLNISFNRREDIKDMLSDFRTQNTMLSLVRSQLTDHKTYSKECPNIVAFLRKFWRTLQIQGFIKKESRFPSKSFESYNITLSAEYITNVIMTEMHQHPLKYSQKMEQRSHALTSAYKKVDPEILDNIKSLYKLDFLMFNYSNKIPA